MRMRNKPLKPFNTSSVNLSRENKKKSLIALIKKKREKERWYFDFSLTRLYTPFQDNAFYVSSRKFLCTSTFRRYLCARDFTRRMKNEIMMTKKKKKERVSLSSEKVFYKFRILWQRNARRAGNNKSKSAFYTRGTYAIVSWIQLGRYRWYRIRLKIVSRL